MNLNQKSVTLFVLLALIVVYFEYEPAKSKEHIMPSKTILQLDEKIFDRYQEKFDTDREFNLYWGFKKEVVKLSKDINASSKEIEVKVTQPDGKNILCIEESCYRLLGVSYSYKTPTVTLYNKDIKEKVKSYKTKEILRSGIIVNKIVSNSVEFKDLNTTREWNFKLFDVNTTKYKPKEIK